MIMEEMASGSTDSYMSPHDRVNATLAIANSGPITITQFKVSKTRITACIMAHTLDSR
jgi:hypothetical protein